MLQNNYYVHSWVSFDPSYHLTQGPYKTRKMAEIVEKGVKLIPKMRTCIIIEDKKR